MTNRATKQIKRVRFLPFNYGRSRLSMAIEEVSIDGEKVTPTRDEVQRVINLINVPRFTSLTVKGTVSFDAELLAEVLPEPEREEPPVAILLAQRCNATMWRRGLTLHDPKVGSPNSFSLTFAYDELFGELELASYLIRTQPHADVESPYATLEGARLADDLMWRLRIDERNGPPGEYLSIRFESFSENGTLPEEPDVYTYLQVGESPVLWINSDHKSICEILQAKGPTGARARLRDVNFDQITYSVWTQLFLTAFFEADEEGESAVPWQQSVLERFMPVVSSPMPTADAVLELREQLKGPGGLSDMMRRLDLHLQSSEKQVRHLTRLIQETLEG